MEGDRQQDSLGPHVLTSLIPSTPLSYVAKNPNRTRVRAESKARYKVQGPATLLHRH